MLNPVFQFWEDMVLRLPEDKKRMMKNKNLSLAERISLYDCSVWPKWTPDFNDLIADQHRIVGNEHYAKLEFEMAIFEYNKCLLSSKPMKSILEFRGLAYANRSAAYFALNLYQDCLDSIRLAKEYPLPSKTMVKVLAREKMAKIRCLEFEEVERAVNDSDLPVELSFRRNKRMPSFVFCLKLKDAGNPYGGIITTENLLPGEVLVLEPTLTMFVRLNTNCDYCHVTCGNLQLCNCGMFLYCSLECKKDAFEAYHALECPLMDLLFVFPENDRVVLRVFFKLIRRLKDVNSLREYLEDIKTPNPFDDDDFKAWPDSGSFESQFRLYYATERPPLVNCTVRKDNLFRTDTENKYLNISMAKTAIIIDMLKKCKEIPRIGKSAEDWSFLSELLFRLIFYKSFTVFVLPPSTDIQYVNWSNNNIAMLANFDARLVPLLSGSASLFRTSCQSNVYLNIKKNLLIVRARKYIPRGTELLAPASVTLLNAYSLKAWFPSSSFDVSRACHCARCLQRFHLFSHYHDFVL